MAQRTSDDPILELGEKILRELEILRKMSILNMSDRGYSQAEIADALGTSQPTISRMFPKGIPKRKVYGDD